MRDEYPREENHKEANCSQPSIRYVRRRFVQPCLVLLWPNFISNCPSLNHPGFLNIQNRSRLTRCSLEVCAVTAAKGVCSGSIESIFAFQFSFSSFPSINLSSNLQGQIHGRPSDARRCWRKLVDVAQTFRTGFVILVSVESTPVRVLNFRAAQRQERPVVDPSWHYHVRWTAPLKELRDRGSSVDVGISDVVAWLMVG